MKTRDIETTKTLFTTGYSEKTILTPLEKYNYQYSKHIKPADHYMVYSYNALPELLKKMRELDPFEHTRHQARYVMQDNGTLWFAVEARPGQVLDFESKKNSTGEQSPAHSEMLPPHANAIAAGIVVFSKDHQRIEGISNFSGHYRPYVTTVVWPLAAFIQFNAVFAEHVSLSLFWKNSRLKSKTITLPKEQLPSLLPSNLTFVADSTYNIAVCSKGIWNDSRSSASRAAIPTSPKDESTSTKRIRSGSLDEIISSPKKMKDQSKPSLCPVSPQITFKFFSPLEVTATGSPIINQPVTKTKTMVNDPFSDWDVSDDENEYIDDAANCKSSGLA